MVRIPGPLQGESNADDQWPRASNAESVSIYWRHYGSSGIFVPRMISFRAVLSNLIMHLDIFVIEKNRSWSFFVCSNFMSFSF